MVAPNPRSLGDSFPDNRSLHKETGEGKESARHAETQHDADDVKKASDQDFQNPMTEEDTASGGPADPTDD